MADYECEYNQQEADYVPSCSGGRREALLFCRQNSGSSVISELTAPTVCESYGSSTISAPRSVTLRFCEDDGEEDRDGAFFNSGAVVIKRGGQRKQHSKRRSHQQQKTFGFEASFPEEGSEFTPTNSAFEQNDHEDHGFAANFDEAFSESQEVRNDETLGMSNMSLGDKKSQKKLQLRAAAEQLKRNEGSNSCSASKTSEEGDWQRIRAENQKKILEESRSFSADTDNGSTVQSQHAEPHWDDSVDSRNGEGPLAKKLTSKAIRSVGNIIKVGGGALLHVASKKPSNYDGLEDDDEDVKKGFSFGGLVGNNRRGHSQSINESDNRNGRSNFADPDRRRSGAMLDRINETHTADESTFNYSDRVLTGQLASNNTRRR